MYRHVSPGRVAPRRMGLADDPDDLEYNPLESARAHALPLLPVNCRRWCGDDEFEMVVEEIVALLLCLGW